jgi:predicted phage baseplate assembly protein
MSNFQSEGNEEIAQLTPLPITNKPGLPAIAYRVGTYAQFKRTMLARLGDANLPGLAGLRTRQDEDFSIALLDAWAMAADVLTFYQERIANEYYKSTATTLASLQRLTSMVNKPLLPAIAGNVYLAFTVEDAPGTPGSAIIESGTKVQSLPGPGEQPQVFETVERLIAQASWNALAAISTMEQPIYAGIPSLLLKEVSIQLQPGDAIIIIGQVAGKDTRVMRRVNLVKVDNKAQQTTITLATDPKYPAPATSPAPDALFTDPHIFVLHTRAALFGHNAVDWRIMPDVARTPYVNAFNKATNQNHPNNYFTDWPFLPLTALALDRVYATLQQGSWCVLNWPDGTTVIARITAITDASNVGYGLTIRSSQVKLDTTQKTLAASINDIRQATVYLQSEELLLAKLPSTTPIMGDSIQVYGTYDTLQGDQLKGRNAVITGELIAIPGKSSSEIVQIRDIAAVPNANERVQVQLEAGLSHQYNPATVTINANVMLALQGETVQDEVLGSGDASQPYQSFTLQQSPLIYTQDATQPDGFATQVEVRVDDIPWKQVPTLYGHGPHERVFALTIDDAGTATLQFGEGYNAGSRVPTGIDNVHASYRKGSAQAGQIQPGQLTLLLTRPLGVKSVTNPGSPTGALAAETADDARRMADNMVLTMGRVVSLSDYEDCALSYAGIAKAQATIIWNNERRSVVVTIAGAPSPEQPGTFTTDGTQVPEPLYAKIYAGISSLSDPSIPFILQRYETIFFKVSAHVKITANALLPLVQRDIEQTLRTHFSFPTRKFGQQVTVREVIAVIQALPNIVTVHGVKLQRSHGMSKDKEDLDAVPPHLQSDGTISLAQLLLIDPQPLAAPLEVLP